MHCLAQANTYILSLHLFYARGAKIAKMHRFSANFLGLASSLFTLSKDLLMSGCQGTETFRLNDLDRTVDASQARHKLRRLYQHFKEFLVYLRLESYCG